MKRDDALMRFTADLHLHSRYASGVSPAMTLENLALWAQRKGVDLLATGDCLQPQWLAEIETSTVPAESGFLALKPDLERAVHAVLPKNLRRSIRFVLSTEVNCVSPSKSEMNGIHQLLYFPSIRTVHDFARRISVKGDLLEGRPTLNLSPRDLVRGSKAFERVHVAVPHVMNPWFSALGIIGGERSVESVYGEQLAHLLAVETGLTSNLEMCRRVPSLDHFGVYSCSDAHSLENIGRECTLLEIEPNYDALMLALRVGTNDAIKGTLKFPLSLTRYFLNWCSHCRESFDAWPSCPQCRRALTKGSRDRLSELDGVRAHVSLSENCPPFETLRPLSYVIASLEGKKPDSAGVRRLAGEIVDRVGHERYVLTEAQPAELLSAASPEITQAILNQRTGAVSRRAHDAQVKLGQDGFQF